MSDDQAAGRRWVVLGSATFSFFVVGLGFFSVPPLLPVLTGEFALDNVRAGLLMGAIAAPAIFLSVPLGQAADRLSARAYGIAALAVMALALALFAAAPSYAVLLLARVLFGVGGLVVNVLEARELARAFAGREQALAMGVFLQSYPLAMIASFSGLPRLAASLGWRGEMAVLAALALLAAPLHLAATASGRSSAEAPPERAGVGRPLLALAVAWCLYFAAFTPTITFAPEWAGGHGLAVVSLVAWISMLGGPLAGRLIDRTAAPAAWVRGGLALLAGALLAMAAGALPPVAAMALVGAVVAVVPTAVYALPAQLVPAGAVGFAFGVITSFSNFGTVVGPALAGALRDANPSWPLLWGAIAAVAAAAAIVTPAGKSARGVAQRLQDR